MVTGEKCVVQRNIKGIMLSCQYAFLFAAAVTLEFSEAS